MRGAATATVISQLIGMVWVVSHFMQKESTVHFEGTIWKMKGRIVESIFAIGMSPFLMNVCACIIVIIINNSLQEHGGDMAIGAYGIINRLLTLYVMIVLGLTMGMQPIVGYNFGAQKLNRVKQTLRLGILSGVVITSSGFLICELFPHAVSALFTDSDELIDLAVEGLRLAVLMFPFVGAQIVIGNFFQSIGKAKISIFLSLDVYKRQGLVKTNELYAKSPAIESENFRNLLLSFAEDMRVILIMIADRVNVMRQIKDTGNEEDRIKVANEAAYLYAPLAHKLGLYKLKSELEDLSLKYTQQMCIRDRNNTRS